MTTATLTADATDTLLKHTHATMGHADRYERGLQTAGTVTDVSCKAGSGFWSDAIEWIVQLVEAL
jgi:hypothetical protein